jgi:hypothetical protein
MGTIPNRDPTTCPTRHVSSSAPVGWGSLHVAVRDNIDDDEIVVETAYQPDPALWEPDFRRCRRKRR